MNDRAPPHSEISNGSTGAIVKLRILLLSILLRLTLWVCGASTFCLRTGTSREPANPDLRPQGQNLAPFYHYTFNSSILESGFQSGLIVLYPVPEHGILTGWRCARAARVPRSRPLALAGRWREQFRDLPVPGGSGASKRWRPAPGSWQCIRGCSFEVAR